MLPLSSLQLMSCISWKTQSATPVLQVQDPLPIPQPQPSLSLKNMSNLLPAPNPATYEPVKTNRRCEHGSLRGRKAVLQLGSLCGTTDAHNSLTDTMAKPFEKGLGCLSNTGCCHAAARILKKRIRKRIENSFVGFFLRWR
jgi:hypothetical protein